MADQQGWDLLVDREDLTKTELVERAAPDVRSGEVLLRVDRVGMTANNVTYGLLGDALGYWGFFPADEGWGRVPLWGYADVLASEVDGVAVGTRVFGYLPTSSHLKVRPGKVDAAGFRDSSEHRASLPGVYNAYSITAGDPGYSKEHEDLQILYRPLFLTSFMLDDFLADNDFFGARTILLSSASSKTSYGTAFCLGLREQKPHVVGLTSAGNIAFTKGLGCYDTVLTYDEVSNLPAGDATLYIDVAGSVSLRRAIHEHFEEHLVHDAIVGVTHHDQTAVDPGGELPGPKPAFFFAPDQIRKRGQDWGPGGIDERYGATWGRFVPSVREWVDVTVTEGPEALRAAWLEVLSGKSEPRTGNVISL